VAPEVDEKSATRRSCWIWRAVKRRSTCTVLASAAVTWVEES
jgi:hypothetical protein